MSEIIDPKNCERNFWLTLSILSFDNSKGNRDCRKTSPECYSIACHICLKYFLLKKTYEKVNKVDKKEKMCVKRAKGSWRLLILDDPSSLLFEMALNCLEFWLCFCSIKTCFASNIKDVNGYCMIFRSFMQFRSSW